MALRRGRGDHDSFFRMLMERPNAAGALLRERLPPAFVRQMVGNPVLVEGSFIDPELRLSQSDRLFRVALRGGRSAYIYCLIEHKSAPDPRVALQLLRYLVRIWEGLDRRAQGAGLLAPVLPLVVYHGIPKWTAPLRFSGMLDASEELKAELLDFPFGLVDLGQIPDGRLSNDPELRAGFLVLKYARRVTTQNVEETLAWMLGELRGVPEDLLSLAMRYIIRTFAPLDRERLASVLKRSRARQEREMLSKLAKELLAEGKAQGVKLGKAQGVKLGEARGEARALLLVLERRFGKLPGNLLDRVRKAGTEQLEFWLRRAVEAASLEAVFRRPVER
jgi:predicted transposase/invertase (TIGR01784 family)